MNLKELYGKRYRVRRDASWEAETEPGKMAQEWRYQEIPGKYGFIYPYSEKMLGVCFTSKVKANEYLREKGGQVIQNGDDETVVLTDLNGFFDASTAIAARKRRVVSPEAAKIMAERLKKALESRSMGKTS